MEIISFPEQERTSESKTTESFWQDTSQVEK